jgi:hypothetical protein
MYFFCYIPLLSFQKPFVENITAPAQALAENGTWKRRTDGIQAWLLAGPARLAVGERPRGLTALTLAGV